METSTILGLVLGVVLVIGSILIGGPLSPYIDVPSLVIVVGGTIASTLTAEKMGNVIGAFKIARNALRKPPGDPVKTIGVILELSQIARREGLLALENKTVDDPFLAKGVRMAVDGVPADQIRETLVGELLAMKQRHGRGQKLFKFMAASAPAMGMIGTLIGLVQMLQSLDDPSSIGPAMAVALLTTLYGAILAFLICGPIAEKLDRHGAEESANMAVIVDGVDSLVKGHNAVVIKDKLQARLEPKLRETDSKAA
ncbi:MAG: MotA/TolQ/ExbB proton channel family protein [Sandaracinus sp.]|nr:MotA/TolQ/ExbB proton channel family protein [Sandaracinus sp.]MCB9621346.1 MotA/TolQ/ExbB proton channel family protein [Sandaracinus sp.]MCB9632444.1 MotA/TolQ/ExbB proton channel family protein [Sandaracinus sp.]